MQSWKWVQLQQVQAGAAVNVTGKERALQLQGRQARTNSWVGGPRGKQARKHRQHHHHQRPLTWK